jgi:amino acid adenylation domain-containing protein
LPLLDDVERHRLLVEVNATNRSWPEAGWVHDGVQGWAERAPEVEAVRFEGVGLSFGELNRKANQLARRLRAAGVGRDVVVGICLERSFELVISVLAVLKAGGAYLPLDPGLPPARRDFMVADAAVPVVLAGLDPSTVTIDVPGVQVWCLPELAEELDREPEHNLDVELGAEDLAYVIYTSGSTGEPKGVMNGHGAIRSRLLWMQDEYGLKPSDRVLQKTPFSFDVSVWELFWPLGCGARLVLARPDGHRDSRYLVDTIRAEGITTVHFVPSMLQAFLREPGVRECVSLRRVICSGEALTRELQDRFFAESGAELHNLYGPTEAAVDVTSWACRRDGDPRPVPIGFPIANTQLYVLDRYLEPVPVGVPGELYIGGRGVARGYVNRTALTAERFRPDPFAEDGAARLFRTGDAGRFRADGALEFLGRLDHQVKLRGFRIELGEIESALAAHPRVREAVVLAREHGPDDVRLVAYLTGDDLNSGELVAHLKAWLPAYMIPSAFVVLPALPLTSNGKIDRAALPDPGLTSREPATSFVAPRDDLERAIAGVWQHLLGGPQVGTHDNFFELGGHSLLMFELRTALVETLGREVSIVELFQYPTVASLTEHLTRPASADAPIHSANERATSRLRAQSQRQPAIARRLHSRNGR